MSGEWLPKRIVFGNLEGGCSAERTGWEGESSVDRLRTERHPGFWHSGGLESNGVVKG